MGLPGRQIELNRQTSQRASQKRTEIPPKPRKRLRKRRETHRQAADGPGERFEPIEDRGEPIPEVLSGGQPSENGSNTLD